jgi:hypothetical protein
LSLNECPINPYSRFIRRFSDITDNLQLLLRKSGHYLHTSAEKEVVRTIKEKTCYIAPNLAREDKDMLGKTEEFRLPDGKVIQVCSFSSTEASEQLELTVTCTIISWGVNDIGHQKSCSTQNSSEWKTRVYIRQVVVCSLVQAESY